MTAAMLTRAAKKKTAIRRNSPCAGSKQEAPQKEKKRVELMAKEGLNHLEAFQ